MHRCCTRLQVIFGKTCRNRSSYGGLGLTMDELKFFSGLTAITLAVIGLFIYFGRKLSKAAERHASEIDLPLYISPSGTVFFACIAAFWVYCAATRALAPASRFGDFLNTFEGVASVLMGSVSIIVVAGLILKKLGYPIWKWDNDS